MKMQKNHIPKSIEWLLFNSECDLNSWKEAGKKGAERDRKTDKQIKQKIIHPVDPVVSCCSFFTLLFLVVKDPGSFFCKYHLYTAQVLGIHRVVPDVPTTWAGMGVSSCFLSHSLHCEIFVWYPNSKPSPPLGLELTPSYLPYNAYVKFLLWWLIFWEDPSLTVFREFVLFKSLQLPIVQWILNNYIKNIVHCLCLSCMNYDTEIFCLLLLKTMQKQSLISLSIPINVIQLFYWNLLSFVKSSLKTSETTGLCEAISRFSE